MGEPCEQDGLSKEEKDQLNQRRAQGLNNLLNIAYIQVVIGVIACVVGILSIVYGVEDTPHWPYSAGFGLWFGVIEIIIAVFGMLAGSEGFVKDEVSTKLKTFVIINYVFCIVSFSPCILSIIWSGNGISYCLNEGDIKNHFKCFPNKDAKIVTSIATILMAVAVGIFSIIGTIFFCVYGKTFGFQSKRERRLKRKLSKMSAEVQALKTAQANNYVIKEGVPIQSNNYYQWDQKY